MEGKRAHTNGRSLSLYILSIIVVRILRERERDSASVRACAKLTRGKTHARAE